MTATTVAEIKVGACDYTGAPITKIIGKVTGRYAVYRTETGVMIHFSDDDNEGANQRAALTPIEPLRGQIEALLEGLQKEVSAYQRHKASEYSGRLGRSLLIALRGNVALAETELQKIRNDMIEDRASDTRTRHLGWACLAAAVAMVIAAIASADWFMTLFTDIDQSVWGRSWYAVAIGALGALFSIALQLRSRTVPIDTQSWDNVSDAVLRIFVGATSAVLLVALLDAKFINFSIDGKALPASPDGLIIVAFTAGFAERLVSEFLSRFALSIAQTTAERRAPAPNPVGTTEKNVTGEVSSSQTVVPGATAPAATPTRRGTPAPPANHEDAPEPNEDEIEASDDEGGADSEKPVG
jgi:hypothetical protein